MKQCISLLLFCIITLSSACADKGKTIYLYGESHGNEKILQKELSIWREHYDSGRRHLFVELSYYTAELLNIWMKEEGDKIINEVYDDWMGTAVHNIYTLDFYKNIKRFCPNTEFHGTDVGHQYLTTGKRYLKYLEDNNMKGTKKYKLTLEAIEQGSRYYKAKSSAYRENEIVANFMREVSEVVDDDIIGIYGSQHIKIPGSDMSGSVPSMASQLSQKNGLKLIIEDLSFLTKDIDYLRIDSVKLEKNSYKAYYYGKSDMNGFKGIKYREFWRIESAFEILKNYKKTGEYLPYDNYPMIISFGQAFMIDYIYLDGTRKRVFYISDGDRYGDRLTTVAISLE